MKKVIIIDDEPLARSIVAEYLAHHTDLQLVQECANGFEGVKAIQHHKPDLVLLDIQMPKLNGFEMLELLEEPPAIIFTTAFDEYALKAFEAHAADYLLKPFSRARFDQALNKWRAQKQPETALNRLAESAGKHPDEKNRIAVRFDSQIRIIPVSEVYYIEAFDDYVKIFTRDDYHLKKKTLTHFEHALDSKQFLRVHRSFLVNLNCISRIEPYEKGSHVALLKDGRKIPLSRTGYTRLRETLDL